MNYWLFNTDDAEGPGKDADVRMKARSVIAAWGDGFGAEALLSKPDTGDTVFFYLNKIGIIAMATFDDSAPFATNDIFHKRHEGEFSRKVVDLRKPKGNAIKVAEISNATGYHLPAKGIPLKKINSSELIPMKGINYILTRFV